MKNQVERKMENKLDTGIYVYVYIYIYGCILEEQYPEL